MKIELKNVKTHQDMSDETLCFSATLYVDGKKAALVSNHGTGGDNDYHFLDRIKGRSEIEDRLIAYCKTLPPHKLDFGDGKTHEIPEDMDSLIAGILDKQETRKRLDRQLKGVIPFRLKNETYKPGAYRILKVGKKGADINQINDFLTKKYGVKWYAVSPDDLFKEIMDQP